MNSETIKIDKTLVRNCDICNLQRISKDKKDTEDWQGVAGIEVRVLHSDEGYPTTSHICEVCNDHIQSLNQIIKVNKLSGASVSDKAYHLPMLKQGKECAEAGKTCAECESNGNWKCKGYR